MRIDILTVLPELLAGPLDHSIVGRARKAGLLEVNVIPLRNYTHDRWRTVDDYAYEALQAEGVYDEVIYTSPDGELLTQPLANELSLKGRLLILCGHYKGVDHRVREHLVTREVSIGDYVLSGGELAAAVMVDAVTRLIPGAIGDETSALTDSFQDGLLAPPAYTRPANFRGWGVPEVLVSGNFPVIAQWQHEQALERTKRLRPELYKRYELGESDT